MFRIEQQLPLSAAYVYNTYSELTDPVGASTSSTCASKKAPVMSEIHYHGHTQKQQRVTCVNMHCTFIHPQTVYGTQAVSNSACEVDNRTMQLTSFQNEYCTGPSQQITFRYTTQSSTCKLRTMQTQVQ